MPADVLVPTEAKTLFTSGSPSSMRVICRTTASVSASVEPGGSVTSMHRAAAIGRRHEVAGELARQRHRAGEEGDAREQRHPAVPQRQPSIQR